MKALLFLILPFLYSFSFSPMSQSINMGGKAKSAQFLIQNNNNESIAVTLSAKKREMDEFGEETLVDTDIISVFPPQLIIPPGEKRTLRVSTKREDKITVEENYRIIAEQLPLNVDPKKKNQAGIKVLMQYVAALYLTPEGAKPELQLKSLVGDGKELQLEFENKGNKHQLINNPIIKVGEQKLTIKDLQGVAGENVFAKKKRVFKIKSPLIIPKGSSFHLKVDE